MPDQPTTANRDRLGMLIHRALRSHLLAADVALDLPRRERITQDLVDAFAPELAAAWGEGYAEARKEVTTEADQAYWRGHELGRRQATEGWEREWGLHTNESGRITVKPRPDEASARRWATPGRTAVSRLVGPWEPDEQHEPGRTSRSCPRCGEPTTGFTGEPVTEMANSSGYVETLSYSRTFLPCGCTKIIDARPVEQPEPVKRLSYCYGPTSTDPDPAAMWCIDCGGQVGTFDGHAVCGCGAQLCESPADCGDDACPYRPASGGVVEPSGPLTAEEATPDCVLPPTLTVHLDNRDARFVPADPPVPYFEGDEALPPEPGTCPFCGKAHGWVDVTGFVANPGTATVEIARRQHDPGALIEEPDLYEQGEGDDRG